MRYDISFYGASIRPELWVQMDHNLSQTDLSIEIVWAGPKGLKKLPPHTKWIKTDVKPIQCWEIAARACTGKIICHLVDDLHIFPYTYDRAYALYEEENNPKTIIQPQYYSEIRPGKIIQKTNTLMFPMRHPKVPKSDYVQSAGSASLYNREFFNSLQGFDNGFIGIHAEQDLSLRAATEGANIIICEDKGLANSICILDTGKSNLLKICHKIDYNYLFSLYIEKDRLVKRLKPHKPFIFNSTILTKSQGKKGKWN